MSSFLKSLLIMILTFNFAWAQDAKTEALKLWQKRDDKESLVQAIKKFEELNKANPADNEFLVYLTRSYFLMGEYHSKDQDEKLKYYEKAMSFGEKSLSNTPEYAARMKKNDEVEHQVKAFGINEVPQMFWTAVSIGKFAKANGIFSSMKYKGKILALVSRVEELKPDYFHGGVPRYWGSYFAVIPSIAGKDLKKSEKYFDKSIQMAPEYVATKVLKAETYYVEKDDENSFKKLLNEVIADSTFDNHPELGPENRLEKIKAKKLLENASDLF